MALLDLARTTGRLNSYSSTLDQTIGGLNQGIIKSSISQLTNPSVGLAGSAYQRLYPEGYSKLQSTILNRSVNMAGQQMPLRAAIGTAALMDDAKGLSVLQGQYRNMMQTGGSRFAMSMSSRLMWDMNSTARKGALKTAGLGLRGANAISKVALGASLGQVGVAAGIVAGLGYTAGSMLGVSPGQMVQGAKQVHQVMKQMNKPTYGSSEIGQSVQGLTFGLHNNRRG